MFIIASSSLSASGIAIALALSVFLIVLNGAYVAYEFAVLASKRSTFETVRPTARSSIAALKSLSDLSMQLAGAQLGITIASLALGHIGEPAFEGLLEIVLEGTIAPDVARIVSFIFSLSVFTFLHLVLGEMVPKNIALVAPELTLRWLVIPYRLYLFIVRPFVLLLNSIANFGCRLVRVEPRNEIVSAHSASELSAIVRHSTQEGAIEADDGELLQGVLQFSELRAGDIATPLDELATAYLGASGRHVGSLVAQSGQNRVPIVSGSQGGDLLGYVHAKDLLTVTALDGAVPLSPSLIRQMAVIPADLGLGEVLQRLRKVKRQLAVVKDRSTTVGVVSVEEVLKALLTAQVSELAET